MDVSVIIPTFHREREVVIAAKSALEQRAVDGEVIFVDDSREGTARAGIEALGDERVRYLAMPKPSNGAPARVRNEGAKIARGRVFHFLDDDDRIADGALAAM